MHYDFQPEDIFPELATSPAGTSLHYASVVTLGWVKKGGGPHKLTVGLNLQDPSQSVATVQVFTETGWQTLWQLTPAQIPEEIEPIEVPEDDDYTTSFEITSAITTLLERLLTQAEQIWA